MGNLESKENSSPMGFLQSGSTQFDSNWNLVHVMRRLSGNQCPNIGGCILVSQKQPVIRLTSFDPPKCGVPGTPVKFERDTQNDSSLKPEIHVPNLTISFGIFSSNFWHCNLYQIVDDQTLFFGPRRIWGLTLYHIEDLPYRNFQKAGPDTCMG